MTKFKKWLKQPGNKLFLGMSSLAVIIALFGGGYWYAYSRPIPNADSTMRVNKADKKYINNTYHDKDINNVVQQHWNGRKTKMIVHLNGNRVTESQLKNIKSINTFMQHSSQGVTVNHFGQPTSASIVYLNQYKSRKHIKDNANSIKKTSNIALSTLRNENIGRNNIITGQHLLDPQYSYKPYQKLDVALMTSSAREAYQENMNAVISKLKTKDYKGIYYSAIPVYCNAEDIMPIGFHISGIAYTKLPYYEDTKSGIKLIKGKTGSWQFNFYLRNVQEHYKINYHTGKVTFNK